MDTIEVGWIRNSGVNMVGGNIMEQQRPGAM
jgi:hypothetical protein